MSADFHPHKFPSNTFITQLSTVNQSKSESTAHLQAYQASSMHRLLFTSIKMIVKAVKNIAAIIKAKHIEI
jgi:hypothetical protein